MFRVTVNDYIRKVGTTHFRDSLLSVATLVDNERHNNKNCEILVEKSHHGYWQLVEHFRSEHKMIHDVRACAARG